MLNLHYTLAILCVLGFPIMLVVLRSSRSLAFVFPAIAMFLVANEIEAAFPTRSLVLTIGGMTILVGLAAFRVFAGRQSHAR